MPEKFSNSQKGEGPQPGTCIYLICKPARDFISRLDMKTYTLHSKVSMLLMSA